MTPLWGTSLRTGQFLVLFIPVIRGIISYKSYKSWLTYTVNAWSASMIKHFIQDMYFFFFFLKMHVFHKNFSHVTEGTSFCIPQGKSMVTTRAQAAWQSSAPTLPCLQHSQPVFLVTSEVSFPALASAHSILMCNKEWVLFYWAPNQSDVRGCLNKTPKDYIWFLPWAIISLTKLGTESVSGSFTMKLLTG